MDTINAEQTILFLLFYGTVALGCNSGWFGYNGLCYQASQTAYDIRMARRYCQIAGGDLAYVNSSTTLQFLNGIKNYDGQNSYWLSESSFLASEPTTTASSNQVPGTMSCPYAKILTISYGDCSEQRNFVCESPEVNSNMECPQGFDLYDSSCYKAVLVPLSFSEAVKHCIFLRGRMAVFDNKDKESNAEALVIGKNATFFVGAKVNPLTNVTTWSNGNTFNPSCGAECRVTGKGDCVGLLSISEHPTRFSWMEMDCEAAYNFLCEASATEKSTTTTTTTEAPTTTLSYVCPHGYYWKFDESSGYCYWETTYESARLNWYQARKFCQLFGGDLASYHDMEQEDRGLGGAKGHYRGLWIGLERGEDDVFRWVDGSELNYTNWDYAQPNLKSRSKFCVSHGAAHSRWELDYCGVRRWFVCKAPRVTTPRIPDTDVVTQKTKCNISGPSIYRSHWFLYKDHCYLTNERNKYTWDTARLFCQDNEAHMASIHSFNETNFILFAASVSPDTDFWIGLSSMGLHSTYSWADASPVDFFYWDDDASNNDSQEITAINSCVAFNQKDGSWKTDHCNRLKGVICKRAVNSSYEFTSPPPTTSQPGTCDSGWYNLGNRCYNYFGKKWSQRATWAKASQTCKEMGASLASIHNQDEQDFLVDLVLEAGTDVWIGLQTLERGTVFAWSDDTRMDFTNWNNNGPEYATDSSEDADFFGFGRSEMCVEMVYDKDDMGKWTDMNCSKKKAFICQKSKDPTLNIPYEDPFECSNITGWYKLSSSCYKIFEDKGSEATWLEAQTQCRSDEANLVNYKSHGVTLFLNRRIKQKSNFFWIGARETLEDKYESLSGQSLIYTNWLSGQPQRASSPMDNCVAVSSSGKWVVKSCKEKLPYICEWNAERNKEPVAEHVHSCSNTSHDFEDLGGDNCYLFMTGYRYTWNEAMYYCFKHGASLASFHSQQEALRVYRHVVANIESPFLHIGLGKRSDGSYAWVDNSPVDFQFWDTGEPNHREFNCVYLYTVTGKWNDVDCDETRRGFICSSPKKRVSDEQELEDKLILEPIAIKGLSSAGIAIIVICVLVIFVVIGGSVYYLWPRKAVQPKLLEQEAL